MTAYGCLILISIDFYVFFVCFLLNLALTEKIYQTLQTVLDHIPKHLKFHKKHSYTCHIFNSLSSVRKCSQPYVSYTSCYPYNTRHAGILMGHYTLLFKEERRCDKSRECLQRRLPLLITNCSLAHKVSYCFSSKLLDLSQSQEFRNLVLNILM